GQYHDPRSLPRVRPRRGFSLRNRPRHDRRRPPRAAGHAGMKALILAAGEGTRLRPLTLHRPKPMLPVGGHPILEHLVAHLRRYRVTDIAINLHYKPDVVLEYFGDGRDFGVSITYSFEEQLLGSAGAAKAL